MATYRKKYKVLPQFEDSGNIMWKSTGNGSFIIAENGRHQYFIKKFMFGPRLPQKSFAADVYARAKKACDWLENKQQELIRLYKKKGLSVDSDHIVLDEEDFWDEDNIFVLVSRMIPEENDTFDYSGVDEKTFIKLCYDMAVLLKKLHAAGITHGDLKEKNILIRKQGDKYTPYLIDFDSSYPTDYSRKKDKEGKPLISYPVVYSDGYQSPEIAYYNFCEEGEVPAETLTEKTDVFTLAIIIHKLRSKEFPMVVGDSCAVGEAVFLDREIKLNPSLDIIIGKKNNVKLSDLLHLMLKKELSDRPSAEVVAEILDDKRGLDGLSVSAPCSSAEDSAPSEERHTVIDVSPHDNHKKKICIFDEETLRRKGVENFVKVKVGGLSLYLVTTEGGTEERLTMEEIVERGYARMRTEGETDGYVFILEPHDLHKKTLEIFDEDTLRGLGLVGFKKTTSGGAYRYLVVENDYTERYLTVNEVIERGYGKVKTPIVCELFDEDAKKYRLKSADEIAAAGIASIERREIGGRKFYFAERADGMGFTATAKDLVKYNAAEPVEINVDINVSESPWPSDGAEYDLTRLAERGYSSVERIEIDGEQGYKVVKDGKEVVVNGRFMKIMKFIK